MITSLKLPTIPRFFSWSVKSAVWYPCSPWFSAVCFYCCCRWSWSCAAGKQLLLWFGQSANFADSPSPQISSAVCYYCCCCCSRSPDAAGKQLLLPPLSQASPPVFPRLLNIFKWDTGYRLFLTLLLITVFLFSPVFKNTAPALTLSVARRSVNSCVRALKSVRLCYLDLGATRLAKRGPTSGNCKLHELYKYK